MQLLSSTPGLYSSVLAHAACVVTLGDCHMKMYYDNMPYLTCVLPTRSTSAQGHAMALKAGTDMACTEYSGHLNESLAQARICLEDQATPACIP